MSAACENCGSPLSEAQVSAAGRWLQCDYCLSIHHVSESSHGTVHVPLSVPDGVVIDDAGRRMVFRRHWLKSDPLRAYLTLGCIASLATVVPAMVYLHWITALGVTMVLVLAVVTLSTLVVSKVVVTVDAAGLQRTVTPIGGHGPVQALGRIDWIGVRQRFDEHRRTRLGFGIDLKTTDNEYMELVVVLPRVEDAESLSRHVRALLDRLRADKPVPAARKGRRRRELGTRVLLATPRPAPPTELACSHCGAPLTLEGIDRASWSTTCGFCGTVKDMRDVMRKAGMARVPERRELLPMSPAVQFGERKSAIHLIGELDKSGKTRREQTAIGCVAAVVLASPAIVILYTSELYGWLFTLIGVLVAALIGVALTWSWRPRDIGLIVTRGKVDCTLIHEHRLVTAFSLAGAAIERIEPIVLPGLKPRWGLEFATRDRVYPAEVPFEDVRHALYFAERIRDLLATRA